MTDSERAESERKRLAKAFHDAGKCKPWGKPKWADGIPRHFLLALAIALKNDEVGR